jgi:hypothetical protein
VSVGLGAAVGVAIGAGPQPAKDTASGVAIGAGSQPAKDRASGAAAWTDCRDQPSTRATSRAISRSSRAVTTTTPAGEPGAEMFPSPRAASF